MEIRLSTQTQIAYRLVGFFFCPKAVQHAVVPHRDTHTDRHSLHLEATHRLVYTGHYLHPLHVDPPPPLQ